MGVPPEAVSVRDMDGRSEICSEITISFVSNDQTPVSEPPEPPEYVRSYVTTGRVWCARKGVSEKE